MRATGVMRDIVGRKAEPNGAVIRELSCGHSQPEIAGGHASRAFRAQCLECGATRAMQVAVPLASGATCSALTLVPDTRRMRVCGAPATTMKGPRPRCARHARKGAR